MSKAKERALKVYPIKIAKRDGYDENLRERKGFVKGYEQAEKELELTWEDMRELHIIFAEIDVDIELCRNNIKPETLGYYQEVLKRFEERKEK